MDTSDIIASFALAVSVAALPISYFVATRQVKVGLDEHERRVRQRTRGLVADRLDELANIFFAAAKHFADLDLTQKGFDHAKLDRHLEQIDKAVTETGILDRLGKAIDDYKEAGNPDIQSGSDISGKLDLIRGLIQRGSASPSVYATWKILNIPRGNELPFLLRKT